MEDDKSSGSRKGAIGRFEPGGDLAPPEGRDEYDQRLESLPDQEKELASESARFADVCQYFERQRMDIPVEIVDQLGGASQFALPKRIALMKKLNKRLMEYLNNVGENPGIRH